MRLSIIGLVTFALSLVLYLLKLFTDILGWLDPYAAGYIFAVMFFGGLAMFFLDLWGITPFIRKLIKERD